MEEEPERGTLQQRRRLAGAYWVKTAALRNSEARTAIRRATRCVLRVGGDLEMKHGAWPATVSDRG